MISKSTLLAIVTLLALDTTWVFTVMGKKYAEMIPTIQNSPLEPQLISAVMAYALMVVGLVVFVLPNIRAEYAFRDSLLYGGTFGLVVYGIFDFTNAAVLKNWNLPLAFVDIAWGVFVYTVAAYASTISFSFN